MGIVTALGCRNGETNANARCSSSTALTTDDFTHDNVTYHVTLISFETGGLTGWFFDFELDKAVPQDLKNSGTLHAGNNQVSLTNGSYSNGDKKVAFTLPASFQIAAGNTLSMSLTVGSAAPPPPPPPPPPVIESPEGVSHSGNPNDGFSLTPLGEGGSIVYRKRTIDIPVTRDECTSSGNPALIISRSTLDRVREITFELSETSPQDPPSGFRMEGCVAEIDPGIRLGQRETVMVCLPPAEVKGESYVHRYDGEWKLLPSRPETVNGEELVCGETDTFSLFGVFLPVIESAEGVTHSEDKEHGFSLTPLGEGGSIVYGQRTIDLSVTGDIGSSGDPAIIVSRSILDRIEEITFELSEISPHDPPPGFYLEGFSAEVDMGVTLGEEETVSVCLPSSGESDIYRYSGELGEWEVLPSRLETVNGEEVVCGDTGAVSLTGVFVEETGGCVIASVNGEEVLWRGAVFNLLLIISVLLLIPGMSRHK